MQKHYLEQYKRVKRWHERFKSIDEGKDHNIASDYYQDEIYAFFINCHHLKDWIISEPAIGINKDEIENFINKSEYLSICADLCIGSKHLIIKSPRKDAQTKINKRSFSLEIGGESPRISVRYKVESQGRTYDAFDLATKSLKKWENFLKSKKLL